jgi:hypothetical protein
VWGPTSVCRQIRVKKTTPPWNPGAAMQAAGRIQALEPHKRYTLAAVLLRTQWSRVLDDLGQMFIKRMIRIHRRGKEVLARHHLTHQERTNDLLRTLRDVVTAYHTNGDAYQRLAAIESVVADKSAGLLEQCDAHEAHAGNNYYPFLWRLRATRLSYSYETGWRQSHVPPISHSRRTREFAWSTGNRS